MQFRWVTSLGEIASESSQVPLLCPIAPSEEDTVSVPLEVPERSGRYRLEGYLLFGGVSPAPRKEPIWQKDIEVKDIEVQVAWAAEVIQASVPSPLLPLQTHHLSCTLKNSGVKRWTETLHLLVQWWQDSKLAHQQWISIPLLEAVSPQSTVTLAAMPIVAPVVGSYSLRLLLRGKTEFWRTSVTVTPLLGGKLRVTPRSLRVAPKGQFSLIVDAENTGWLPWKGLNLKVQWQRGDGTILTSETVPMPKEIAPREKLQVPVSLSALELPSDYRLYVTLDGVEGAADQVAVTVVAPIYLARWEAVSVPERFLTSEKVAVRLRVTNLGSLVWQPTGHRPIRIGYQWQRMDGRVVTYGIIALPRVVNPNEKLGVSFVVVAPCEPGEYVLLIDLWQHGVGWWWEQGSEPLRLSRLVVARFRYTVLSHTIPTSVQVGQTYAVSLRLRNDGGVGWDTKRFRLGFKWVAEKHGRLITVATGKSPLPHPVEPGQEINLQWKLPVPTSSGRYTLIVDLVSDDTWLSTQGATPLRLGVSVR